jgi:hypothetical protein
VITADPAGTVLVMRRPLRWDGRELGYGPAVPHQAAAGFVTGLRPGDWVSMHWDCVCDRLSQRQLLALRRFTARHLRLADAASVTVAS